MKKIYIVLIFVVILLALGVGAWFFYGTNLPVKQILNTNENVKEGVGIANPASSFCIDNGGKLEIRTESSGGQVGFCIFKDNSECEEWAYFREECNVGDKEKVQ